MSSDFEKNAIRVTQVPQSKVALPESSKDIKIFLDSDNVLKRMNYDGSVSPLTPEQIVQYYQTNVEADADQAVFTFKVPNPTKKLLELEAALKALITASKEETQAAVEQLVKSLEAAKAEIVGVADQTDAALNSAIADLEKQVAKAVSLSAAGDDALSARLDTVSSDLIKVLDNINRQLAIKATKKELADVAAQIPAVKAGSTNVKIDKVGFDYIVSVEFPEVTREIVREIKEMKVGTGVSQRWVMDYVATHAASGGGGTGTVTTIESSGGSIIVSPIAGGFNIEVGQVASSWTTSGSFLGYPATVATLSGNALVDVLNIGDKVSVYTADSLDVGGVIAQEVNGFNVNNISGSVSLRSLNPAGGGVTLLAKRSDPANADTSIVLEPSPFDNGTPFILVNAKTVEMNLGGVIDQPASIRLGAVTSADMSASLTGTGNNATNGVLWRDISDNRVKVDQETLAYVSEVNSTVASASGSLAAMIANASAGMLTGAYLPISGGTLTGNVTFNKQISSPAGGTGNEAFGATAMNNMKGAGGAGQLNTACGGASLFSNQTGSGNTAIGYDTLSTANGIQNNIAIGYSAGAASTADNCVYLGWRAGWDNTTNERFIVCNASTSGASGNALLYGEFNGAGRLFTKGNLIITTANLSAFASMPDITRAEVAAVSAYLYSVDVATSGALVALTAAVSAELASRIVPGITGSTFTNKVAYGYTDKGVTYDADFSYDPASKTIDVGSITTHGTYNPSVTLGASTAAYPSMMMTEGVVPATPADGAVWMISGGLYYKSGGTIKGALGVGAVTSAEVASASANAYVQAVAYDALQDAAMSASLYSFSVDCSSNALAQANAYTNIQVASVNPLSGSSYGGQIVCDNINTTYHITAALPTSKTLVATVMAPSGFPLISMNLSNLDATGCDAVLDSVPMSGGYRISFAVVDMGGTINLDNVNSTYYVTADIPANRTFIANVVAPSGAPILTANIMNLTTTGCNIVLDSVPISAGYKLTYGIAGLGATSNVGTTFVGGVSMQTNPYLIAPKEYVYNLGSVSGSINLDLSLANYFTWTLTGNSTVTFINPPIASTAETVTVMVNQSATNYTITWNNTRWAGGVAGTLTPGGLDMFNFATYNAGSFYIGTASIKDIR